MNWRYFQLIVKETGNGWGQTHRRQQSPLSSGVYGWAAFRAYRDFQKYAARHRSSNAFDVGRLTFGKRRFSEFVIQRAEAKDGNLHCRNPRLQKHAMPVNGRFAPHRRHGDQL